MANIEHFEVFGGENRTLTLHGRDSVNAPVNLTGKTIAWRVGRPPNDPDLRFPVFSYVGTPTVTTTGVFSVSVLATDTMDLHGEYLHQAITTDGSGSIAVVSQGRLKIRRMIDPG